ncbi:AAA family ATPase [Achromobacter dolens]|uniref:AAA family ATPase n=1 Tax=Achromobacter dolens TaxID=1287738 RepID=UPI003558523B
MHIKRIQIEEGFLNGFDLSLSPGLNVLIGARGTGKTSVIELIRFALGAKNHTSDSQTRSLEHARAVLDGGEVSVCLGGDHDDEDVTVVRSGDDESPRASGSYTPPIVLSQMEIETLGLSELGRLTLIDGFISGRSALRAETSEIMSAIRSAYKEISSLEAEIVGLSDGLPKINELRGQLDLLKKQQLQFEGQSKAVSEKQNILARLNREFSDISIRDEVLTRFSDNAAEWAESLNSLTSQDYGVEPWDGDIAHDPLEGLRSKYRDAVGALENVMNDFSKLQDEALERKNGLTSKRTEVERQARTVRAELDKLIEGSGALARQVSAIETQIAQSQAREKVSQERGRRLLELRKRRNSFLARLQELRDHRAAERARVASILTGHLSPHIKIELISSSQYGEYAKAISAALRGSGMKYVELATTLSQRISPRELLEIIEKGDFDLLSELADIPKDRAARLVGHLKDFGTAEIATCDIEDSVRMGLLDGLEYKDIMHLSAGQRCTVILSIVLQHKERTLVIDQPEDHLDNAFIASTVIKALRERKGSGQVILSTHNANIPVLGDADRVIELTSDGRNGFLQLNRPLHHPDAVNAITNVMEGGLAAFEQRAEFYKDNHL